MTVTLQEVGGQGVVRTTPAMSEKIPDHQVGVDQRRLAERSGRTTLTARPPPLPPQVPHWVHEALINHRFFTREKAKVAFYVKPAPRGGMSGLMDGSSRLEAMRILRIKQVIKYVAENLVTKIPVNGSDSGVDGDVAWDQYIEIVCNDRVLPGSMDLYSARMLVWRNPSEDMVFLYRRIAGTS